MENGHNIEDVVAKETGRPTVERGEAAKGAARLGVWVRVGSMQSLGGSPGPVGGWRAERRPLGPSAQVNAQ